MDLRQIRYFCAVCATGSFSRAATAMNVSQPALSKQVRQLEDALGVLLLIRDGRGVRLTPQGAELFERLSGIETQLADARAAVTAAPSRLRTIAIGATPLLGPEILAAFVTRIQHDTPFAEIRLIEGYSQQIHAMLRGGNIDIALAYDISIGPHAELLGELTQGMNLVIRSESAGASSEPATFEMLSRNPILTFDPPSRVRSLLSREAEARGMALTFRHAIDSLPLILTLVGKGEGISVLPLSAVEGRGAKGLSTRCIGPEPLNMTLQVAASLRSGVSSDVYSVADCISAIFQERCAPASGAWTDSSWVPLR